MLPSSKNKDNVGKSGPKKSYVMHPFIGSAIALPKLRAKWAHFRPARVVQKELYELQKELIRLEIERASGLFNSQN